jgi:proteasome accessory factor B
MDPDFFLPSIDLNLREALALLLLVHKARNQIQLPFKNSALLAALKIENNLPAPIRKYCNTAIRNISTRTTAQAPMPTLDNTFARLQNAITKKRTVNIVYDSFFEGKFIDLDLRPYHMLYHQRAWYVLGYSGMHKSVRTFKLNRIKQLKVLDKCFVSGDDFDLEDYLGRAWAIIPQGRIYHVKLRFLPMVARNVAEVHWHSTQTIIYNSDGSITAEFRVDGLGEITWWILGYGDQVRVLEPKTLRKKIRQIAQNMTKLNTE